MLGLALMYCFFWLHVLLVNLGPGMSFAFPTGPSVKDKKKYKLDVQTRRMNWNQVSIYFYLLYCGAYSLWERYQWPHHCIMCWHVLNTLMVSVIHSICYPEIAFWSCEATTLCGFIVTSPLPFLEKLPSFVLLCLGVVWGAKSHKSMTILNLTILGLTLLQKRCNAFCLSFTWSLKNL